MCGICGIFHYGASQPVPQTILEHMNQKLTHRGPDDSGIHLEPRVGLGSRRLSIIDLTTGHQPLSNESEDLWITFNGEIYNYRELREILERGGRRFRTQSDTEVILQMYEEYGPACVKHLRGMFAFALWDRKNESLMLARDRIGKKPLLYATLKDKLIFASEMQSLLQHPEIPKRIRPHAIDLYLALQYIPSPWTIFQDVHKLPPAHILLCRNGKIRVEKYWDLPLGRSPLRLDFHQAQEALLEKLKESVRLRLISDVPLGAFLSGGIDSTCVVGLMSELSPRPVDTFSIGFEEESFSELPYARAAARAFGCNHHEFIVKPEMTEVLPKLALHYGEPFADASALPSYYVARETRKFVTVALNGDGGDENFAGYLRYRALLLLKLLDRSPAWLKNALWKLGEKLPEKKAPLGLSWRLKRLLSILEGNAPQQYLGTLQYFTERQKQLLYSPFMKRNLEKPLESPLGYLTKFFEMSKAESLLQQLLYVDFHSYLPECLMAKMDIASMANSLEARSPFLDHHVMELAFQMPPAWKLKHLFLSKWILRQTMKSYLPKAIYSRGKQGFGIPVSEWLRGKLYPLLQETVLSPRARIRGYFSPETLPQLVEMHRSRKKELGYQLWALLMLELWHHAYDIPSQDG